MRLSAYNCIAFAMHLGHTNALAYFTWDQPLVVDVLGRPNDGTLS